MVEDHEEELEVGGGGGGAGRRKKRGRGGGVFLGGREQQLQACLKHLAPVLEGGAAAVRVCAGLAPPGGLLIYGQGNSGKTSLCHALAARLSSSSSSVATIWVDCSCLRGHKMSVVLHTLTQALERAKEKAPSLLVFDDMDGLCPAENEEGGEANVQAAEIGEHVWELLQGMREGGRAREAVVREGGGGGRRMLMMRSRCKGNEAPSSSNNSSSITTTNNEAKENKKASTAWAVLKAAAVSAAVAVVVTAKDPTLLHASLRRPGGLEALVEIPPLDAKAREAILNVLLATHSSNHSLPSSLPSSSSSSSSPPSSGIDLAILAARLEGCTLSDLELLTTRALHAAVNRTLSSLPPSPSLPPSLDPRPALLPSDFTIALEGFTAASLRNARLSSSSTTWADVGGLRAIKDEVRDVLETPVKFAPLYSRLPTRLPTGLLLYGPPGCGKTLLAGAVAKECGLNFISVKGPEVLDKYIGASEAAVRTLFARATAAAPCVLFFDEFEALAPRRGNDNTGVTDRVVNQLLTFLDGVEGRSGVYVMGATSRPDMVDPALLRPGRLDRQLYLGFPNAEERGEILRAVARKMELTSEAVMALDEVAKEEGAELLTGADLQALVSTAQLQAVHDKLAGLGLKKKKKKGGKGGGGSDGSGVVVTAEHVWAAFAATRPSMPLAERAQFQAVYDKFRSARDGEYKVASATDDGKHLRTALK